MNYEYQKMLERFEQICQNAKKELCGKKEKEQEKRFIEKIDKRLTISEYDEIEYLSANVKVLDINDYILNNSKAKILVRYLKEKQQEIERLNNIINKIDKYANKLRYYADEDNEGYKISKDIHNILQELKGSDK